MLKEIYHKVLASLEKDELLDVIQQMANTSREVEESLLHYFADHQERQNRKSDAGTQLNIHWERIHPKIRKANKREDAVIKTKPWSLLR